MNAWTEWITEKGAVWICRDRNPRKREKKGRKSILTNKHIAVWGYTQSLEDLKNSLAESPLFTAYISYKRSYINKSTSLPPKAACVVCKTTGLTALC